MTIPVTGPQYADDPRQVARWIDEEGKVQFDYVDITDVSFKGRFGMAARSDTEHDVSIGNKTFYLDRPVDMRVGDDVQIVCLNNYDLFMWGEIADIENAGEADMSIEVYIDDICPFDDVNQTNWEIQVVARPKPGIEKDVSFTEIDPSDVGPFQFEVTAGKFFPIGGQLLIKPTADRTIALLGRVLAYEGTTLWVEKNVSNASISEAYDSWSIALLDAPPASLPLTAISGLETTVVANLVTVSAGSVMDSTGTVLLTVVSPISKNLSTGFVAGLDQGCSVMVPLTGTVSGTGSGFPTITGVGTDFLGEVTDSSGDAHMSEFTAMGGTFLDPFGAPYGIFPMISATTRGCIVSEGVASDTSLQVGFVGGSLDWASSPYFRGALYGQTIGGGSFSELMGFIVLIRKDTDGEIDVCFSSATPSGEPDLPAGYSVYRVISGIYRRSFSQPWDVVHHIHNNSAPFAPKASGFVLGTSTFDPRLPEAYVLDGSSSVAKITSGKTISFWRDALTGDIAASLNANATTAQPAMITGKTEKTTLVDDDLFLIADSEASFALKKVKNINAGGGGGGGGIPTDWGLITEAVDDTEDFGTIV